MESAQHRVDLALRVAHADLEDPADVVEDDEALGMLRRYLRQASTPQERSQHGGAARVHVADVVRLVAGPRLARDLLQPREVEGPAGLLVDDEPGRLEPG